MGPQLTGRSEVYHPGAVKARFTVAGMEKLADALRDMQAAVDRTDRQMRRAADVWRPLYGHLRVRAAQDRSEAYVRLFRRRPRGYLLWGAMRWAFIARWREATREA